MNMTPVLSAAVILSLIMPTEPTFYPIAEFPDEMSCGAVLARMTHDAQCAVTYEAERFQRRILGEGAVMTINNHKLTPTQSQLVLALLREEAQLGRMGEAFRARSILTKIGEEV